MHPAIILAAANTLQCEVAINKASYWITAKGEVFTIRQKNEVKQIAKLSPFKSRRRGGGHCLRVCLRGKHYRVQRLVAYAFLSMPLNSKKQVNHLNKNTDDNRLSNLEVATAKRNARHRSLTTKQ